MSKFNERLKRNIARRRGLDLAEKGKVKPIKIPARSRNKTLAMRHLEVLFGSPIEDLIMDGKEREVGERLGLDHSTISKWKLRLGLRGKGEDHGQSVEYVRDEE